MKKSKKEVKEIKEAKEAKILGVNKYVKGDCKITETVKEIAEDTDFITTPWGTRVKANDVTSVLEEFYSLSPEERENEREAWVGLISKIMGQNKDGLKIVDVKFDPNGSRAVRFIYR